MAGFNPVSNLSLGIDILIISGFCGEAFVDNQKSRGMENFCQCERIDVLLNAIFVVNRGPSGRTARSVQSRVEVEAKRSATSAQRWRTQ